MTTKTNQSVSTENQSASATVLTTSKAYPVYGFFQDGKLKHIGIGIDMSKDSSPIKVMLENHVRLGTIHSDKDIFVHIHKGFAGKENPTGKQYGLSQKTTWIPYDQPDMKKYRIILGLKQNDYIVAKDRNGNTIMNGETQQPMVVKATRPVYCDMVPAEQSNVITDYLKKGFTMPFTIVSDGKVDFTFYRGEQKLYYHSNHKKWAEIISAEALEKANAEYKAKKAEAVTA